ncbi:hypothetical protein T11_17637 [Trichinella zimbabwensis]|uniref:Uncharacterized protein n=1 Tax=Trichinella zimbabwensis TaxID=268475 RepID=A0A0V1HMD0_9BILA|nr:hypothetical protein T11_17637 [Trichinella zimbabwensis]
MLHELALYTANSLDLTRVANVPSIGDQLLRITIYHRLFQYWDLLAGNKTFSPFWNTSCLYKYPFGDQLITNNITENSVFTKNMTAVRIWIALPKSAYNFVPKMIRKEVKEYSHNGCSSFIRSILAFSLFTGCLLIGYCILISNWMCKIAFILQIYADQ